jgi:hypothetical protein
VASCIEKSGVNAVFGVRTFWFLVPLQAQNGCLNTYSNIDVVESNSIVSNDLEIGVLVEELAINCVGELRKKAITPLDTLKKL